MNESYSLQRQTKRIWQLYRPVSELQPALDAFRQMGGEALRVDDAKNLTPRNLLYRKLYCMFDTCLHFRYKLNTLTCSLVMLKQSRTVGERGPNARYPYTKRRRIAPIRDCTWYQSGLSLGGVGS